MRKILMLLSLCMIYTNSYAQSEQFNRVFKACIRAQEAMSYGVGSQAEIKYAALMLKTSDWSPLILKNKDVRGEASLKNHLVFSPKNLFEIVNNDSVFDLAREYKDENISSHRGGNVQLVTKCIKKRRKVSYTMRKYSSGEMCIGAVAETGGLINLTVETYNAQGKKTGTYKETSNEFKGERRRLLNKILVTGKNSFVNITLENKSNKDKSVAIIVE